MKPTGRILDLDPNSSPFFKRNSTRRLYRPTPTPGRRPVTFDAFALRF